MYRDTIFALMCIWVAVLAVGIPIVMVKGIITPLFGAHFTDASWAVRFHYWNEYVSPWSQWGLLAMCFAITFLIGRISKMLREDGVY